MRRVVRFGALLAAVSLACCLVVPVVPVGPTGLRASAATSLATSPATSPAVSAGETTVDDAQLRWGVNDEVNNRAFAPGTLNFLSAGAVPDPGRGGAVIVASRWRGTEVQAWRAEAGDVRIEKLFDGAWTRATFAGLGQTTTGAPMSGTNGPFSGHQVVVDGGRGVVDRAAGTAAIDWQGSFSIVFYSGMSFFTVTDPQLRLTPDGGTLTGELAGYASSMDDQSQWRPVTGRRVVLADLPRPTLGDDGFSVTPRYLGVTHAASTATAQVRSGVSWGSFPTSFVSFLEELGSASYWFSSGGSADRHKVAAPVTISYAAARAVTPVTTSTTPGVTRPPATAARPRPPTSSSAPSTGTTGTTGTTPSAREPGTVPRGLSAPTAAGTTPPATGAASVPPPAPRSAYALQSSSPTLPRDQGSDHRWTWWVGSVLLLLAAATTVQTLHIRRSTTRGPR